MATEAIALSRPVPACGREPEAAIVVGGLDIAYGDFVVQLDEYTELSSVEIRDLVALKLALVGLAGFEDYCPSEISGSMRKRAGVARALGLNPGSPFFDELSAGLDPVTSSLPGDLIVELHVPPDARIRAFLTRGGEERR